MKTKTVNVTINTIFFVTAKLNQTTQPVGLAWILILVSNKHLSLLHHHFTTYRRRKNDPKFQKHSGTKGDNTDHPPPPSLIINSISLSMISTYISTIGKTDKTQVQNYLVTGGCDLRAASNYN